MTQVMSLCEKYLLRDPPSLSRLVLANKYSLNKLSKVCMEFAKETNPGALKQETMYDQIDPVLKVEILEHHIDSLNTEVKILKPSNQFYSAKSEARLLCLREIRALAMGDTFGRKGAHYCRYEKESLSAHELGQGENCVNCLQFRLDGIKGKLEYYDYRGRHVFTEVMT